MTVENELLSVTAAAERLQLSRSSVYRLVRRGEINPVYPMSDMRITSEEIERYLRDLPSKVSTPGSGK